jgi:hypothetical protein
MLRLLTDQTTMKRLAELCLGLFITGSVVLAQSNSKPEASTKTNAPTKSAASVPRPKADELREYQLRVLKEHTLARTVESMRKMNEAGLRLSARNQILTYLASVKNPSDENEALATQLALEALTDLREHGEEILPFMFSYLSSNLGSWIQKHRPKLTEEFEQTVKANAKVDASQRIRSLFQLEGGDVLAAKHIRQELEEQGALNGLHFWLEELMNRKSKEFEPLAADIVARAGHGQISFETLFWISGIYLAPQTSEALRNRFLTMVVARTQPQNLLAEPTPQMAYDLLTEILPFIQRSVPELHEQALNQHVTIRAVLSERQLAIDARIKRLKESDSPIEDLISEAESTKSTTERNELLLQAAQLALEKKNFDRCLDILEKVDGSVAATDPDLWRRSIDQILRNFVRSVLGDQLSELAEKAATRIGSPLSRVEALNLIMRYYAKANKKSEAQRLLSEATKAAVSGPDETQKAKAFFLLSITCDQVDRSKKSELLLSGINVLNSLTKPDSEGRDKTAYQDFVLHLDNAGHELVRGFKGLTKQAENDALTLVEKLLKPDLRTFALIGILLGLDELQTEPARYATITEEP